jgi:hypothetical protein
MPTAIGIRVYLITLRHKQNRRKQVSFNDPGLMSSGPKFIDDFVSTHVDAMDNEDRDRSWYMEEKEHVGLGSSRGYIHYGTYGFESNFIDNKTKVRNYRRRVTDVEEIPLFFEFWCPPKTDHAFAAFQSFQGRSCIHLVTHRMEELFEAKNPDYVLRFKKLLPNDVSASAYYSAPVKRLWLIKRNYSADLAEKYLPSKPPRDVNFEISLTAKRKSSLGPFSNFAGAGFLKGADGVIVHEGISFNDAVAEINVGVS